VQERKEVSKVLVDRELLENCCDAAKDAHAASLLKELEAILDKPAEAEGLDIIGYMDGDYRRDQPSIYIPHVRIVKSCAKGEALMTVTQHLAALSAVTAERDRLREDAERWRYVSLQGDDMHWLNLLRVDLDEFGGNINAAVDALIDGEAPAMAAKEA
jgi:hypothetical protein